MFNCILHPDHPEGCLVYERDGDRLQANEQLLHLVKRNRLLRIILLNVCLNVICFVIYTLIKAGM